MSKFFGRFKKEEEEIPVFEEEIPVWEDRIFWVETLQKIALASLTLIIFGIKSSVHLSKDLLQ